MYPHSDLTHKIIAAAIEVHKNLGPGLLESVYRTCLGWELENLGLRFQKEVDLPLISSISRSRFLKMAFVAVF